MHAKLRVSVGGHSTRVWSREGALAPCGAITVTVYPQEGSKTEMELNALTSVGCKPCESEFT